MNEEEYNKRLCFLAAAICAFLIFVAYISTSRGSVSNISSGIEPAKQQLEATSNYQQSATADVERAERFAEASKVRLGRIADSTERLQSGADESAKLIADCQRIVREVQERGAKAPVKN